MPSPIGHAIAGVVAGWGVAGPAASGRALKIQTATLAALGAAPDLDLLIGRHRAEAHSVGAAILVAGLAALWRWPIASTRWRIGLAACAAWASHPLLDVLADDTARPIGVMAFWPFSHEYYQTGLAIFSPITRRWWTTAFFERNAAAGLRELAILLPILGLVWWLRTRR